GELAAVDVQDSTGEVLWSFPPNDQKHPDGSKIDPEAIYGTPVVADGIVYFGAYDGWVYALDLVATEPKDRILWEFETGGP
ncbi:MAG: PQQ-binding-like beta-propeller repeat protein, partial [Anaerolineae bacterium]|nr:PQQ-binding-like beta-propeller repeat protein [Anaerolineae bacterium]